VVTRDDVEESLKALWQYVKDKEQLLKDLHSQIEETDQRLSAKQGERDYWLEYKNVISKTQANKIMNLEKDIKEVKDNLQRATGQFTASVMQALQALSNAVRYLDKSCRREIEENEWLKEEVR
ncbi:CCD83 protein, partial [Corythaeola cristata]|nr:CCD83 protein [Corythaeola cristata]